MNPGLAWSKLGQVSSMFVDFGIMFGPARSDFQASRPNLSESGSNRAERKSPNSEPIRPTLDESHHARETWARRGPGLARFLPNFANHDQIWTPLAQNGPWLVFDRVKSDWATFLKICRVRPEISLFCGEACCEAGDAHQFKQKPTLQHTCDGTEV